MLEAFYFIFFLEQHDDDKVFFFSWFFFGEGGRDDCIGIRVCGRGFGGASLVPNLYLFIYLHLFAAQP